MSNDWEQDGTPDDVFDRTYVFDKFVEDLERREKMRRENIERNYPDHNKANRLRDARNREDLHNRIRWNR